MHDPMVVVFDVPAPIPSFGWRVFGQPGTRWGARWALFRRRYVQPAPFAEGWDSPLAGSPMKPWYRPAAWECHVAGRVVRSPALATVWHVEPGGADSGQVCKGMGGSDLTWANVRWAWGHRHHLEVQIRPYLRVRRWLVDRCAECGRRFRWREARFSTWGGDKVWHEPCHALMFKRAQLDDALSVIDGTADANARWRVERAVKYRHQEAT